MSESRAELWSAEAETTPTDNPQTIMKPDYRVYGRATKVTKEQIEAIEADLPFDTMTFSDNGVEFEHEGFWVDADTAARALAEILPEDGKANIDVIDNVEWLVTRYVIAPGHVKSWEVDPDAVLEPLVKGL